MSERNYFLINAKLPSLNEYQDACRSSPYKGANLKTETEKTVLWALFSAKNAGTLRKVKPEEYPVKLRVWWHEKDRRRDVDNIKSAAKFVLDAMVQSKVIENDARKYVAQIYDEIVDDKQTFVVVEIIPNGGKK